MSRLAMLLLVVAFSGLAFAFLYQPRGPRSRLRQLTQRIRTVAYAYVLAVIIAAALRLIFHWGS